MTNPITPKPTPQQTPTPEPSKTPTPLSQATEIIRQANTPSSTPTLNHKEISNRTISPKEAFSSLCDTLCDLLNEKDATTIRQEAPPPKSSCLLYKIWSAIKALLLFLQPFSKKNVPLEKKDLPLDTIVRQDEDEFSADVTDLLNHCKKSLESPTDKTLQEVQTTIADLEKAYQQISLSEDQKNLIAALKEYLPALVTSVLSLKEEPLPEPTSVIDKSLAFCFKRTPADLPTLLESFANANTIIEKISEIDEGEPFYDLLEEFCATCQVSCEKMDTDDATLAIHTLYTNLTYDSKDVSLSADQNIVLETIKKAIDALPKSKVITLGIQLQNALIAAENLASGDDRREEDLAKIVDAFENPENLNAIGDATLKSFKVINNTSGEWNKVLTDLVWAYKEFLTARNSSS